jgi:signal transduction histidine kinase
VAEIETIFEEFEQPTIGTKVESTGLGLPLVELHGEHLWAESEPGKRSTFRFSLPIEAGCASRVAGPDGVSPSSSS